MPWRPFTPRRSDEEIAAYVTAEVAAGRIPLRLAQQCEKALRDEADGKAVIMRNPHIKPRLPKRPSDEY